MLLKELLGGMGIEMTKPPDAFVDDPAESFCWFQLCNDLPAGNDHLRFFRVSTRRVWAKLLTSPIQNVHSDMFDLREKLFDSFTTSRNNIPADVHDRCLACLTLPRGERKRRLQRL